MKDLPQFLVAAKRETFASGNEAPFQSRPASHDFRFEDGGLLYTDTYLGGKTFIGEEAVWAGGNPVWGMNYYGYMLVDEIPEGFSPFLKAALRGLCADAPFRGPREYHEDKFGYHCGWKGDLKAFQGTEEITLDGIRIYQLDFHGGEIV
jgi:hypothetical protein